MASPLDHLEKTLADNYRKEIDQEENVWRSLPFFAATLALQLAAVLGLADKLPPLQGEHTWWVLVPISVTALATLLTLVFMAAAIAPARFRYIAPEPDLREYALQLEDAEQAHPEIGAPMTGGSDEPPAAGKGNQAGDTGTSPASADAQHTMSLSVGVSGADALSVFRSELARQYALATHNNRLINQRRARHRSVAGLCVLLSVLATLVLVGVTVHYHMTDRGGPERPNAGVQQNGSGLGHGQRQPGTADGPISRQPRAEEGHDRPAPAIDGVTPGHARGSEGVVDEHGASRDGGRVREGGP